MSLVRTRVPRHHLGPHSLWILVVVAVGHILDTNGHTIRDASKCRVRPTMTTCLAETTPNGTSRVATHGWSMYVCVVGGGVASKPTHVGRPMCLGLHLSLFLKSCVVAMYVCMYVVDVINGDKQKKRKDNQTKNRFYIATQTFLF